MTPAGRARCGQVLACGSQPGGQTPSSPALTQTWRRPRPGPPLGHHDGRRRLGRLIRPGDLSGHTRPAGGARLAQRGAAHLNARPGRRGGDRGGLRRAHGVGAAPEGQRGGAASAPRWCPWATGCCSGTPRPDRVIWNIGGICNTTVVGAGAAYSSVWAFDAGPGNMVIDRLAAQITEGRQTYDADGALAAQGSVAEGLLDELMTDSFVQTPPPKAARPPAVRQLLHRAPDRRGRAARAEHAGHDRDGDGVHRGDDRLRSAIVHRSGVPWSGADLRRWRRPQLGPDGHDQETGPPAAGADLGGAGRPLRLPRGDADRERDGPWVARELHVGDVREPAGRPGPFRLRPVKRRPDQGHGRTREGRR
jgi:hypothetical protein